MRIVLDTNVLISAHVFPGGTPEAVYRLVLSGVVDNLTSTPLLAEFARVLQAKFGWDAIRTDAVVTQLARNSSVVAVEGTLRVIAADPADDRVLETAVAGSADAIVSGDRHLLTLKNHGDITILTPAAFLDAN